MKSDQIDALVGLFGFGGQEEEQERDGARLGLKTALYSTLGDDETGRNARAKIAAEGVAADYLGTQPGGETNRSFILDYQTERTILVYHAKRTYQLPELGDADWIYLTSLGHGHLPVHEALIAWLGSHPDTRIAFNPGTHQLKDGTEKLRPILARTDILFVNKEEAQRLVGDIEDIKELLRAARALGPKIAVITDGTKGAYAHDGASYWHCDITGTEPVERTGAGDAFATGFLAATFHGESVPEAMRWGTMNSGSVISLVGPQAGLLTREQMQKWLTDFAQLQPTEL